MAKTMQDFANFESSIKHQSIDLILRHPTFAQQVLKSVAASLQRERDMVRCDLLKADQENVTLSFKVATLTQRLSYASQIRSLPSEGGSLKNSGSSKDLGDSGQETVSTVAAQDAAQNASVTTSQVMNGLHSLAFGFSYPTSNFPSMVLVWRN